VPNLSVLLFGPPQIKRGNEQISIQRRKDLALLIYLVVTSQPHSRDALATLLWQDQSQTDARSNLRKSLSRLKILLGNESILLSSDQVSLNPNLSINLDIAQFDVCLRQVREHKHPDNGSGHRSCRECQRSLEKAVDLYHANFLQGFSVSDSSVFEEWQFFQSESLRKNLAEILEQLARLYADRQEYKTAIEYSRRWVALDRLNESAQRQLITLYALSGQRAAAKRQFEECKRILKEELGAEPEDETLQLFKDLQKKRAPQPSGTTTAGAVPSTTPARNLHHFPVHPAPFIGREKELGEIIRVLRESPYRLLTLLGPGGSGKTRLALQVGATLDQDAGEPFQDGIWFVPLAPLTEPKFILGGIAQNLGMARPVSGSDALDTFLSGIRGREMLLILDNLEHLLNGDTARLITEILRASPRTRILITSRERLNVEGEFVFPVGGLEIPTEETLLSSRQGSADFTAFSALQLFEQCAIRVQPDFNISEENYRSVVDICDAVQGMPLAIELAASWVEIYSPSEIYQEIVRSLDFLQSNWRDLPDRQRSLRAVFDSSWSLLDKTTRPVIKALSVFRSSFTRESAQAISGASAKTLLDLTHRSWIQRLSNGRYQIHELLRQFAFEKLESEQATFALVMKEYGKYYAAYTARLWEDMKGANQQRAFSGMEAEFDNIHVAWSWLVSAHDIETAVRNMLPILFHYAELRVKTVTLIHMLDLALASLPPYGSGHDPQIRQQEIILRSAKGAFLQSGDSLRASIPDVIFPIDKVSIRRAWTLAQKHDAFQELGFWGILLCYVYGRILQYDEGVRQLKRVLPYFERTHQAWELATGYLHLLKLLIPNEPYGSRRRKQLTAYLSHARDIFASLGDAINTGHIMSLWGDLKNQQQDVEGAIEQWQLARNSFLNTGEWAAASVMLWQLCDACLQIGDFQKAFDGYREIAATFREHGLRLVQISALSKESFEKARHGDIEEALQIRRTCLEMILETGVTYQFAWNYWEMGDLLRVKGDAEAASEWYERAYQIFDSEQDHVGRCYYFRGMGDIALGKQNYESARDYFSTSVDLAKSVNHTWMVCYSLSKLARAQVELQDVKPAKKNFRAALQYGMKTLDQGIMLVAVIEYAEFCSKLGRNERAVELCTLVQNHFASWHETKKHASILLDSIKKSLPRKHFNEAQKHGRSLDVWKTVESLVKKAATSTSKALQSNESF
jgi:predicted ATPase/DNA-binding SARP family transcriptional activator/predicted negative regulator of RcsB-dependent stress response